jgi:hypothetical protein
VPFEVLIPIVGIISGTIMTVTAMALISRHLLHRRRPEALPSDEVLRRLDRIEQIVDTTAIEVERLAESNRFVAKLLADRTEASRSPTSSA